MNDFDIKKVANALIFFLDKQVSFLTKTKFIKMMFFVDMLHLEKYGRSVFADSYIKLPKGPIPSLTLNTINAAAEGCDNEDTEELVREFSKYISVQCKPNEKHGGNMTFFIKESEFDERIFSRSEIESLNRVADSFINFDVDSIIEATHETEGFKNAVMKGVISEESMSGANKEYVSFWEKEIRNINSVIN